MIRFFCLLLLMCGTLKADRPHTLSYIEGKYRVDTIEWRLKEGAIVESFAEAKWKNIQAFELRMGGRTLPFAGLKICGQRLDFINFLTEGGIILGSPCSHFQGAYKESCTSEKFHTKGRHSSSVHGGDFSCAFALCDRLCQSVYLTARVGYGLLQRNLKMPHQRLYPELCDLEATQNLINDFCYKIFWQGPLVQAGMIYKPMSNLDILAEIGYQRAFLRGSCHWQLHENLDDGFILNSKGRIRQNGIMNGIKTRIGTCYTLECGLKATLTGCWELFRKSDGSDKHTTKETWQSPYGSIIGLGKYKTRGVYDLTFRSWSISAGVACVY